MRHPFDGVVAPKATRRSWVKVIAGVVAGWFGYAAASRAVGPPKNVKLVPKESPEPGDPNRPVTKALIPAEAGGKAATLALNEQGGAKMTKAKVKAEAGGKAVRPVRPPVQVTTLALGEEGKN